MTDRVARYSVTEAKRNFRELVARVGAGERIVVTRRGTPVMALVPPGEVNPMRPSRPVGLAAVAGALADWQDLDDRMGEVHATRDQATDRSPRQAVRYRHATAEPDLSIGAIANELLLTLVNANTCHFGRIAGLRLESARPVVSCRTDVLPAVLVY